MIHRPDDFQDPYVNVTDDTSFMVYLSTIYLVEEHRGIGVPHQKYNRGKTSLLTPYFSKIWNGF